MSTWKKIDNEVNFWFFLNYFFILLVLSLFSRIFLLEGGQIFFRGDYSLLWASLLATLLGIYEKPEGLSMCSWTTSSADESVFVVLKYPETLCFLIKPCISLIFIYLGDRRGNQNPQLTVLQIILLREHNRIATVLSHINPHWDDETLFQEARRILIAEYQHINYYEYLPIILGKYYLLFKIVYYHCKSSREYNF